MFTGLNQGLSPITTFNQSLSLGSIDQKSIVDAATNQQPAGQTRDNISCCLSLTGPPKVQTLLFFLLSPFPPLHPHFCLFLPLSCSPCPSLPLILLISAPPPLAFPSLSLFLLLFCLLPLFLSLPPLSTPRPPPLSLSIPPPPSHSLSRCCSGSDAERWRACLFRRRSFHLLEYCCFH